MSTLLVGDTHANGRWVATNVFPAAVKYKADRILQLGDFGYGWNNDFVPYVSQLSVETGIPFYWIDGNHENFDLLTEVGAFGADKMVEIAEGVQYIPRGHVWDWDGETYLACGGAYSVDRNHRVKYVSWWPQEQVTEDDVQRCLANIDGRKIDVMVTHDAPSDIVIQGFHAEYHAQFADSIISRDQLQRVWRAARPRLLFHGHHHVHYTKSVPPTIVTGLACDGKAGNVLFRDPTEDGIGYV